MIRKIAPGARWHESSTAGDLSGDERTFVVMHPFHPLNGREFRLVTYRLNWGEDRVYFHDDQGDLRAIPATWTSVSPKDPFCEVATGRCVLRFVDLQELLVLVQKIAQRADDTSENHST